MISPLSFDSTIDGPILAESPNLFRFLVSLWAQNIAQRLAYHRAEAEISHQFDLADGLSDLGGQIEDALTDEDGDSVGQVMKDKVGIDNLTIKVCPVSGDTDETIFEIND